MALLDWGTRPFGEYPNLGGVRGDVLHLPGFSQRPIYEQCSGRTDPAVLDVTVESTSTVGVTHGLRVYSAGGKSVFLPMRILLCARSECPATVEKAPLP